MTDIILWIAAIFYFFLLFVYVTALALTEESINDAIEKEENADDTWRKS